MKACQICRSLKEVDKISSRVLSAGSRVEWKFRSHLQLLSRLRTGHATGLKPSGNAKNWQMLYWKIYSPVSLVPNWRLLNSRNNFPFYYFSCTTSMLKIDVTDIEVYDHDELVVMCLGMTAHQLFKAWRRWVLYFHVQSGLIGLLYNQPTKVSERILRLMSRWLSHLSYIYTHAFPARTPYRP